MEKHQDQDPIQNLLFDFSDNEVFPGEDDVFASEDEAIETALFAARNLLIIEMKKLNQGMLTEKGVSELLDFIGPFGPGMACFNAYCMLETGRIDGDYEHFCCLVRRQCRKLMESGRVRFAGQKRNRQPRQNNNGGDLFGFMPA